MAFWRAPQPLILASRSRVRRKLLQAAGVPVEVHAAEIDERALEEGAVGATPEQVALMLARAKAAVVAGTHPGRIVLAADQTLACEGRIYHKPENRDSALAQIDFLRARTHVLHAAVVIWSDGACAFEYVSTARLTMRDFSRIFLESYLDAAGEAAFASVGGYQLEGIGVQLFEKVEGDYFTILGLPLLPVLGFLRHAGYLAE